MLIFRLLCYSQVAWGDMSRPLLQLGSYILIRQERKWSKGGTRLGVSATMGNV